MLSFDADNVGYRRAPMPQGSVTSLKNSIDDISSLLSVEPLTLFNSWFEQAQLTDGIHLATSACMATASRWCMRLTGRLSLREQS